MCTTYDIYGGDIENNLLDETHILLSENTTVMCYAYNMWREYMPIAVV